MKRARRGFFTTLRYILLTGILSLGLITIISSNGGGGGADGGGVSSDTPAEDTEDIIPDGTTSTIPSAPTGLNATVEDNKVILTWESVSGAAWYNIYWSVVSGLTTTECSTRISEITATTYTHIELSGGTTYYYVVTAENSAGESEASSVISGTPTGEGLWMIYTVDSEGFAGNDTSLALDSNGKIHISYVAVYSECETCADEFSLRYATNASGSWVSSTIDSELSTYSDTSLAVDSNDKVHISYFDPQNGDLKYATNASGSWVTSMIDGEYVSSFTSLAVDSNDKVHISYYQYNDHDLKYATNVSGDWVTTTVDDAGDVGAYNAIAMDENDKVHISYNQDPHNNYTAVTDIDSSLKYATNGSGAWVINTVDDGGDLGGDTSIAVDSNDKVHISYYDYENGDLKYATNASGSWAASAVDSEGTVGWYASLAIDSNNMIHIGYHDYSNLSLKYATNASGSWVTSTVEDLSAGTGTYTSIALDSNDKVHLGYHCSEGFDLKYATNSPYVTPPAPTNIFTYGGDEYVSVSWIGIETAVYNIYWATWSGVSQTDYEGVIYCATNPYAHTSLTNGTQLYYVITAENAVGESDNSAEVTAVPEEPVPVVDGDDGNGGGGSCPTYSDICYCDGSGCSYAGTVLASCGCPSGTSQYGGTIYIGDIAYVQCICNY